MRPNDVQLNPHVHMPDWLLALQQALHADGPEPPPETLTPLAALDEVAAIAGSSSPESGDDRASLRKDLGRALESGGSETQEAAQAALDDFRRHTLSRLPEMLATQEGARLAAAAAAVLASRLLTDAVAAAAWRDVVAAFEGNDSYETCALRLGVLRELIDARGHIVEAEVSRLARIINDSAKEIADEGSDVAPPADGESYAFEERAGLTELERLRLIERYVSRAPREEPAAVWLVFFDAAVTDGVVEAGSVRFIDAHHMRERLEQEPSELERLGLPSGRLGLFLAAQLLEDIHEDDQAVIARVQTTTRRGQAVEWARRTASAFLDAATVGQPHLGWRLADGHLLASERLWSHRVLRRSGVPDMSRSLERFIYRPDQSLAELDPRLVAAWETGRDDAVEAIGIARWHRAVTSLPDQHFRLVLSVRNLERTLPGARLTEAEGRSAHWTRVVAFYLKERWCWTALLDELDELRIHAVSPSPPAMFEGDEPHQDDDPDALRQFHAKLDADTQAWADLAAITGSTELISRAQLITHVPAIAELMPAGSSRRRLLDTLATDTADANAVQRWLKRLGSRFDTLIARTVRQRNAVVHGGGTSPAVVARTLPFAEYLALIVVRDALAAATNGVQLAHYLEEQRVTASERRAASDAGKPLVELV